jgi:hypothetical protein
MKLPNFLDSPILNQLRHAMGARRAERFGPEIKIDAIELPVSWTLSDAGIDVALPEVAKLKNGTLGYQDTRVVLYIRDAWYDDQPKFHIAFCSRLKDMERDGKYGKYVAASAGTGEFLVRPRTGDKLGPIQPIKLKVCRLCLDLLNWQGYETARDENEKKEWVAEFSLAEFFERYPRDLIPRRPAHTAETAPPNEYPDDWEKISWSTRKASGFRCEKCAVHLPPPDCRFLDVHHRNGLKYDSSPANLQVLCIGCHADEPQHEHMKKWPRYNKFIAKYRLSKPSAP